MVGSENIGQTIRKQIALQKTFNKFQYALVPRLEGASNIFILGLTKSMTKYLLFWVPTILFVRQILLYMEMGCGLFALPTHTHTLSHPHAIAHAQTLTVNANIVSPSYETSHLKRAGNRRASLCKSWLLT